MNIREATPDDWPQIWPIFHDIVKAGDTYAYQTDTTEIQAKNIWLETPNRVFVVEENKNENGKILATYYLKTNQAGPGKHVCNCGYMVANHARGKGIATLMCKHSQQIARDMGYLAMQFNFVASSNTGAVTLWTKLGFTTVGRLPKAFNHPDLGFVDALVMFKTLSD